MTRACPSRIARGCRLSTRAALTGGAKQIKMADKICNLGDITPTEPADWRLQCKREYLDWAEKVVAGCRGCSPQLEQHFDAVLKEKRRALTSDS